MRQPAVGGTSSKQRPGLARHAHLQPRAAVAALRSEEPKPKGRAKHWKMDRSGAPLARGQGEASKAPAAVRRFFAQARAPAARSAPAAPRKAGPVPSGGTARLEMAQRAALLARRLVVRRRGPPLIRPGAHAGRLARARGSAVSGTGA